MFSAALWDSARVSRAGDDVLGIADFFLWRSIETEASGQEVRFGATPKPGRRGDRSSELSRRLTRAGRRFGPITDN